jgi:UDP-N-acetyl-D-glucosamine dehydrogenase
MEVVEDLPGPSYLSWRVRRPGHPFRFVELAGQVNDRMPHYIATRIGELLFDTRNATAGLTDPKIRRL